MRGVVSIAAIGLVLLNGASPIAAARQPQSAWWQLIHGGPVDLVRAGPHGRIYFQGQDAAIHSVAVAGLSESGIPDWARTPIPAGVQPVDFAVGPEEEIYLVAQWLEVGLHTVFRARRAEFPRWQDLRLDYPRLLFAPAVAPDGTLWVGASGRDMFRLAGQTWVKEITPFLLGNKFTHVTSGGRVWVWTHSRGNYAIYQRRDDVWTVVYSADTARQPSPRVLHFDDDGLLVQHAEGARYHFVDGRPSIVVEGLPPRSTRAVAMNTSVDGWFLEEGRLFRYANGRISAVDVQPSRVIVDLFDLGSLGLFALDRDKALYVLREGSPDLDERVDRPGGLPLVTDNTFTYDGRIHGLAVLTLGGRELVYLVNHDERNGILTFDVDEAGLGPSREALEKEATRLGLLGAPNSKETNFLYDLGAVTADLDGDRDEDLVLYSLYDGNQLLRNVDDDHFVDWTDESGIRGVDDRRHSGACLLDADADGDLDLYVSREREPDRLLLNNGAAVFTDATAEFGIATRDSSHRPSCADLDGDGDTDIAVATDSRGLVLHENLASGGSAPGFRSRTLFADARTDPSVGPVGSLSMESLAVEDLDGDGLPEIFVAVNGGCDVLLRNAGDLQFDDMSERLPDNQPCGCTYGADFADLDHDGDLDMALAGRGGGRFYHNVDGRFMWNRPPNWDDRMRFTRVIHRGSLVFDLGEDGDLDVLHALENDSSRLYRNDIDDDRYIMLRIAGPPGNTSAVGATVRLYRAGSDELLARRQVPGASGYASHSSKWVHFGGVDAGNRYDVAIDLPGAKSARFGGIEAPHRGVVQLRSATSTDNLTLYRVRHAWREAWFGRWLQAVLIGTAVLAALALIVFPLSQLPRVAWVVVAATPVVAAILTGVLPVDPGLPLVWWSAGAATLVGAFVLGATRRRMHSDAAPEMIVELSFAVRTFRHNRFPQRVMSRLSFMLQNLGDAHALSDRQAEVLREDLMAYRHIVLPELRGISRLAAEAGLVPKEIKDSLRRQRLLLTRLPQRLREPGKALPRNALSLLESAIDSTEDWLKWVRRETDGMLGVELEHALEEFVATRGASSCEILLENCAGGGTRVRFLEQELHRVLDVLLENAVEAMRGNAVKTITITKGHDDEDGRVRLEFRDVGPGVAPDEVATIFRTGISSHGERRGYGLFYARRAVERFGGRIDAANAEGGGLRITLELDRVESTAEGAA